MIGPVVVSPGAFAMTLLTDHASKRREQRIVSPIGIVVAGMPILFQLLMSGGMLLDPGGFPLGDKTLSGSRFWPIQIVLLCVAVARDAAVDWIRVMRRPRDEARPSLSFFLFLTLFFVLLSIMFSVSMPGNKIGWTWFVVMSIFGLLDLVVAYLLVREIAILDA